MDGLIGFKSQVLLVDMENNIAFAENTELLD